MIISNRQKSHGINNLLFIKQQKINTSTINIARPLDLTVDEWGRVGDGRGWGVGSHSLVFDISNIARVGISNVVGDHLGAAVGEGNTVLAVGGVAITSLVLAKVCARVLISHAIFKGINWGSIGAWVPMDWDMWHGCRVKRGWRWVDRSRYNGSYPGYHRGYDHSRLVK